MYKSKNEAYKLRHRQLVICCCPGWNEEHFQIAVWDANEKEFMYSGQPNDMFHGMVISFMPIDDYGEPYSEGNEEYFKQEFRTKNKD